MKTASKRKLVISVFGGWVLAMTVGTPIINSLGLLYDDHGYRFLLYWTLSALGFPAAMYFEFFISFFGWDLPLVSLLLGVVTVATAGMLVLRRIQGNQKGNR